MPLLTKCHPIPNAQPNLQSSQLPFISSITQSNLIYLTATLKKYFGFDVLHELLACYEYVLENFNHKTRTLHLTSSPFIWTSLILNPCIPSPYIIQIDKVLNEDITMSLCSIKVINCLIHASLCLHIFVNLWMFVHADRILWKEIWWWTLHKSSLL